MSDKYNKKLASDIKSILYEIGEKPFLKVFFLTNGYKKNPSEILKSAMFSENYSQMVLVKDIELYSLCELHNINGYIVGLSKIPRIVDVFSRRLQVRKTDEIKDCMELQLLLKHNTYACK